MPHGVEISERDPQVESSFHVGIESKVSIQSLPKKKKKGLSELQEDQDLES